jgi:NADH-quinone oxidoreductase subunit J
MPEGTQIIFWITGALLIISALGVAFLKNLFHSVLALAAVLILTAVLFLTLQAEFIAAVQILLYTGGVITLVVFAIMLTEKLIGERLTQTNRRIAIAGIISLALMMFLIYAIQQEKFLNFTRGFNFDATQEIASGFLVEFVIPFEALSLLLLASLIGALVLAKEDENE